MTDKNLGENVCTCKNTSCKEHPSNHKFGCVPCVAYNLKNDNIPRCFFYKLDDEIKEDFTFEHFARLVDERNGRD